MPKVRKIQNTKIQKKKKERGKENIEQNDICNSIVQTAMKYLVTCSQCKIAKRIVLTLRVTTKIVLLVRDSRTERLSFGLTFLYTQKSAVRGRSETIDSQANNYRSLVAAHFGVLY